MIPRTLATNLVATVYFLINASLSPAEERPISVLTNTSSANLILKNNIIREIKKDKPAVLLLKNGWHDVKITSKGYLAKKFKVFIDTDKPRELYFGLNRLPSPDTPSVINPTLFPEKKVSPFSFVSSCKKIGSITSKSQLTKLSCNDRNLADELSSTGPHLSLHDEAISTQKLLIYKFISLTFEKYTQNWNLIAERLYQITSQNPSGFEAVSWASLFEGDCNRVSEMYSYMKVLSTFSPSVWLFKAVCHEIHGDRKKALEIIGEGIAEKPGDLNNYGALYYHKARIQLETSIKAAQATLAECMQTYPLYGRCFSMASDLELANGNLRGHYRTKLAFQTRSKKSIRPIIDRAITLAKTKKYSSAISELNKLEEYGLSFAASWLRVLIERTLNRQVSLGTLNKAAFSSVYDPKSAAKVFKLIDNTKVSEDRLNTLKILIRDLPKKAYYNWKLSLYHLENGDCKKVFEIPTPQHSVTPKILTGLLEHKARCYLRNNSFDEAKDIFVQMIRLTPSDWRVHYQLANAYHENNKKYKAISSYRESISLRPPAEYTQIIKQKLQELGDSIENESK